jgi:hypothetical protein
MCLLPLERETAVVICTNLLYSTILTDTLKMAQEVSINLFFEKYIQMF